MTLFETAAQLRLRAEAALKARDKQAPEAAAGLSHAAIQALLHDLTVHQIELELQNQELRQSQEALDISHARYFDLYDLAPVGYCTLNAQGLVLESNLMAASMLGLERRVFLNRPFSRFIFAEGLGQFLRLSNEVLAHAARTSLHSDDSVSDSCELRMLHKDGSLFWVQIRMTDARDAKGEPVLRLTLSNIEALTSKSQHELGETEKRLALATGISGIGIWDWNLKSQRLILDDAMHALFKLSPEDFPGTEQAWIETVFPQDRERVERAFRDAIAGKTSLNTEFRIEWPGGEIRHIQTVAKVFLDEQGTAARMLGTTRDITDRRREESAVRESDTMLRRVVDGFGPNVFVGLLSPDGGVIMINQPALALGGLSLEDVANQPIESTPWFRHSEETRRRVRQAVLLASRGTPSRFDMQVGGTDDQTLLWIDFSLQPVFDESGRVSHLVPSALLIQERKLAEAQLLESETRLAGIVDMALDAIITVDAEQLVVVFNPAAEVMFRLSLGEALGQPLDRFIPARFRADHRRHMEGFASGNARAKPMMAGRPLVGVRADGEEFPLEASISQGKVEGVQLFTVVLRDITERLRAEQEKSAIEEQLRQSQKMEAIGTLAGGIAHDFNNALAVIQGNTQLALEDIGSNEPAKESLAEIHKASTRARNLVQQILSFSRRQATQYLSVKIEPVVRESVRLLSAALPARVTILVDCDADVPAVMADAGQIEQILINLGTNALQAIGEKKGSIEIRLDSVELDDAYANSHPALRAMHAKRPGRTMRLAVKDTGPGMDAATVDRIFEPFFTTKPVGGGTGLGLSVVHGITQSHGGVIEVTSQPGHGTVFTLYLPMATTPAAQPVPAVAEITPTTLGARGKNILYIDDEEPLVVLARRLLEPHGHRVSGYTDPFQALEVLRADPLAFDVVITDYNMPSMSGLDVAREVRRIRADLPVAIASGFADEALHSQYTDAGVREIVSKMGAMESFREVIERLTKAIPPA